MSIAYRITLMMAVAMLSLIGVGCYSLWGLGAAQNRFENIQENIVPSIKVLEESTISVQQIRVTVRDHLLSDSAEDKEAAAKRAEELEQLVEKNLNRYEKELLADDTDKKLLDVERAALAQYVAVGKILIEKNNAKDAQAVRSLMSQSGDFSVKARQLTKNLADHMDYNWKLAEDLRKANREDYAKSKWIQISIIVLALAVSGGLGFAVISEIRARLNHLSDLMSQVNKTLDFTVRISPIKRMDEIGSSADAFNKLLDRLQGNLKSIAASTQSVASAANEMSATSNQVATASHQQSEASSNMAATVEEMTVSINHVGDRAVEANRISSESGQLAISGARIIGQTVKDIQEIATTVHAAAELIHGLEQHSQEISKVVEVIKEVADQTNLLALNAAIEAARAGEQGRGFAVVADEVRKLAERTSASTKEISTTIETMRTGAGNAVVSMQGVVSKVAKGVERAEEANAAITQIGEGSRNAVGMVDEITEAIREQGSATNNIALQVERIAQMSEESSAAAGNSAQAAQELDRLATDMQKVVSAYRL